MRYFQPKDAQEFRQIQHNFALHLIPFVGAGMYFCEGEIKEGVIALAGDIASVASLGTGKAVQITGLVLQGGVIAYRGYELVQASKNGDLERGAAISGELVLRIITTAAGAKKLVVTIKKESCLREIAGQIDTISRLEAGQSRNLEAIRNIIKKLEEEQGGLARHLEDVRRERLGEVVSRKTGGDPHSHISEIRLARDSLRTRVDRLKESLKAPGHDASVRNYIEDQIRKVEEVIRRMNDALGG